MEIPQGSIQSQRQLRDLEFTGEIRIFEHTEYRWTPAQTPAYAQRDKLQRDPGKSLPGDTVHEFFPKNIALAHIFSSHSCAQRGLKSF